jgi:hypothetical protein
MTSSFASEEHLYTYDYHDGNHSDEASHSGISMVPERREARISEGIESGGQEMHEGGRNQDAGAEVPGQE